MTGECGRCIYHSLLSFFTKTLEKCIMGDAKKKKTRNDGQSRASQLVKVELVQKINLYDTICQGAGILQWVGVVFHHLHGRLRMVLLLTQAEENAVAPSRGALGA